MHHMKTLYTKGVHISMSFFVNLQNWVKSQIDICSSVQNRQILQFIFPPANKAPGGQKAIGSFVSLRRGIKVVIPVKIQVGLAFVVGRFNNFTLDLIVLSALHSIAGNQGSCQHPSLIVQGIGILIDTL